jgi:hypothetical protein
MVYYVVGTTAAKVISCPEDILCGNQVIKSPFQIKNQNPISPMCGGYPEFELICSSNQTMIELPHKVKLNVENIDCTHQTIHLSNPQCCLYKLIHNLNLSKSHFNYFDDLVEYYFFNCSLSVRDEMDSYFVRCLSTSNSQIYAIPSYEQINYLPLYSCTKMFNVSLNPSYSDYVPNINLLRLMWLTPNCKDCESKGKICGWKNSTTNTNKELYCFAKNKQGNLPYTFNFINEGSILGSMFVILLVSAVYHIYDSYGIEESKTSDYRKVFRRL